MHFYFTSVVENMKKLRLNINKQILTYKLTLWGEKLTFDQMTDRETQTFTQIDTHNLNSRW
jgi:hypothetical protein